ncbi:hypothetical protein CfE428DRAFT_3107 [Chthoniobacter flavus Ellin428]|uniref:Uncharacterized protein n=1 Tax=Chthoniobacter flavus Ellin428 TaxID=497964 RepID=B4D2I2_9BACT|nr:hypothetical protein CfE428DRAFT_3107 [Chthoniobacter flavus Ellin428]TCO90451.1 hypothetical protein EV701_11074 [Chthoniobacter flavus]
MTRPEHTISRLKSPCLRRSGALLFTLAAGLFLHADALNAAAPTMGINLTNDRLFADAMRGARPNWDSPTHYGDGTGVVGLDGWPAADASIMLWEGVGNNDGNYFIQFNGKAKLGASFGYASFSNQMWDPASNTTTAWMTVTSNGVQNFSLVFTNTQRTASSAVGTGVTNVKVMRPLTEGSTTALAATEMFTDQAENLVSKFKLIRFMDLTGTNGNTQTAWTDRMLPSTRKQSPLAWEHVVRLCNDTNCDAYINIPERASDDYITKLAQLFKYGSDGVNPYTSPQANPVYPPLASGRKIYIENSNEVWNGRFGQFNDNLNAVKADIAANNAEYAILNFDNLPMTGPDASGNYLNQYPLCWRRIAKRLADISNLWRGVWGDGAMMTTIRPIFEFQYANAQNTAVDGMDIMDRYYDNGDNIAHVAVPRPVSYYFWGAGGATYFGAGDNNATTIDGIFASGVPYSSFATTIAGETIWPKAYGLQAIAYEGGWSVQQSGGNGYSNPAGSPACESKYDPRAKQAEIDAQNIFNQCGGDVNVFYASSGVRTWIWGMTDNIFTLASPLYDAIDALNASTQAAPTVGAAVPATGISSGNTTGQFTGRRNFFIRATADGLYNVTANIAGPTTVKVYVDGRCMGTRSLTSTGTIAPVACGLTAGLHTVSFRNVSTYTSAFTSFAVNSGAAGLTIQYEAEDLVIPSETSPAWRIFSDPAASAGYATVLDATAPGDFMTLLVPNVAATVYRIKLGIKEFSSRGISQMSIGRADNFAGTAANVGAPFDEYLNGISFTEIDLGTWSPGTTSDKWFQFKITGKDAASAGYSAAFDYIKLIPQ